MPDAGKVRELLDYLPEPEALQAAADAARERMEREKKLQLSGQFDELWRLRREHMEEQAMGLLFRSVGIDIERAAAEGESFLEVPFGSPISLVRPKVIEGLYQRSPAYHFSLESFLWVFSSNDGKTLSRQGDTAVAILRKKYKVEVLPLEQGNPIIHLRISWPKRWGNQSS